MVRRIGLAIALIAAGSVWTARADVLTYVCGGSGCNGNLYAVWLVSHIGNTYVVEYDIDVTSGYTGSPTDLIKAVALKGLVSSDSNESLIAAPGGVSNWNFSADGELSAGGCSAAKGGTMRLCVEAKPPSLGAALFSGGLPVGVLAWRFQFDSPDPALDLNPNDTGIKYLYVDTSGDKVGSLGSWGFTAQCTNGCDPPPPGVPEPMSLVLLTGVILAVLALAGRSTRKGQTVC